ncbi:MAG: phosphoribosylaminoimidazolesuccinocarboxamide synthase [Acidobacteriota bacterium]
MTSVLETRLAGVPLLVRGKVRDVYDLGSQLLFVATDRISAFDYILPTGIPDKGRVLNQLSLFWYRRMENLVRHHVITASQEEYPPVLAPFASLLKGRSMLVQRLEMYPVECVVRGYLAGSGWKEYVARGGTVCGLSLPSGLRQAERLPHPIFTPATKAKDGHDENISFDAMVKLIGGADAERLRDLSLALYRRGVDDAAASGILLADTKFEFGRLDGRIILGDEVLTPDSSRFWDKITYRTGISPPSLDKQFVRDYLEEIGWDKRPPVPDLPPEIVAGVRDRYREIYRRLAGEPLPA